MKRPSPASPPRRGFSVFVSNDTGARNGKVGGAIAAADTPPRAQHRQRSRSTPRSTRRRRWPPSQPRSALLGTAQGNVGALENRLQFAVGLAQSQSVNTQAAESRIRDANIAEESANMTKFNILTQSGIAALSQANQSSQSVLSLLR